MGVVLDLAYEFLGGCGMIEVFEHDGNIIYLQANGKLTHDDYQQVLIPRLEQVINEHGKARVLLAMGESFTVGNQQRYGMTPNSA